MDESINHGRCRECGEPTYLQRKWNGGDIIVLRFHVDNALDDDHQARVAS